ncbi:uncharacterized protein [Cardiocondyla obscurior]|uniref:uncharacterized protein n=1 Tax=Cardiocondyla obscurior TaxID=286306 RepID=UPI00396566C9
MIEIPRKISTGELSLHTFCDASAVAYAAAVFARIKTESSVKIELLSAKSRIVPEKATIPRLELLAASIAVRLTNVVAKSLTRNIVQTTFWSDSTTVLAWIKRDIQWGVFVRNRVDEIRKLSSPDEWLHIKGTLNPADLPSRGCSPTQLLYSRWWQGPEWLLKAESDWPSTTCDYKEEEISVEAKVLNLTQMVISKEPEFVVRNYFSFFDKYVRFLAWANRFFTNCKKGLNDRGKVYRERDCRKLGLTFAELQKAEVKLFRYLQNQMFGDNGKGELSAFNTTKDENGLYVLKTKIFNRKDNPNFLCPIILSSKHEVVYLMVREIHEKLGHAGVQIIMCHLRERFWIISLRKIARTVIVNCVVCKRQNVKRMECEEPPLPSDRVRDAKIFEIVGVDLAGPLILKGGDKGWICIFTCAVYRAIHLELVSSLSTHGFLEGLRRFIARRGRPKDIYCYNGTNFKGAANMFKQIEWEKVMANNLVFPMQWHFNPPSAPWWGGWWERLIRIVKNLLRKMLGKASLSYETMYTFLCDVEAIINSRPLTYVSEDPDDLRPLSPSMFLQEVCENGVADCDMLYNSKLNRKIKRRQQLLEDVRKRFQTEYLGQLLLKERKNESRQLRIGDIVLIGDDFHKRIVWPLARIIKMIPGRDGKERVFVLKTKSGICKRPIQRLYPLEIAPNEPNFVKTLGKKKDNSLEIVITRSGRMSKKPDRLGS